MGIFFGTDGIRGVACEELNYDLAFKCGNALASERKKAKIIIGRDTRTSGNYLSSAFAVGAMSAGSDVIDVGICTTPGVAYLTKKLKCDYGVIISASHNPAEFNGIKIFNADGFKLSDKEENRLEKKFIKQNHVSFESLGQHKEDFSLVNLYINYLKKSCSCNLNGLKVVLDASNGASFKIAPKLFKSLGADVVELFCNNDGLNINNFCGSLFPEQIARAVVDTGADMGFAFDGDADRIIACDQNGDILDGDILTYILAKDMKRHGKLKNDIVVGTRHTNMGLEKDLKKLGIKLERTDIGDKYVLERMLEQNLSLGGEKSGHIIISDFSTTGDGVLCAIKIAELCKTANCSLAELKEVKLYPQCNIDIIVSDKMRIINSELLSSLIEKIEKALDDNSRLMVRVSGTEPKIRIMVESLNLEVATLYAKEIENVIKQIDGGELCVE